MYPNGYAYKRTITIPSNSVTSALTDFPMLISSTHDSLRSTSNDGNVENGSNLDIRFETTGGVQLAHEIEKYVDTTGELVAWVKIPGLSSSSNTIIEMYYGNSSAPNEQDITSVWSEYYFVHHLNGTAEVKGVNFTNTGSTDATGIAGQGRNVGSADRLNTVMPLPNLDWTEMTWGMWVRPAAIGALEVFASIASQSYHRIQTSGQYFASLRVNGSQVTQTSGSGRVLTANAWNYCVMTYDGALLRTYVNGVAGSTNAVAGTAQLLGNSNRTIGAYNNSATSSPFTGALDEYRLANAVRSPGWLAAEYKNISNPSAFYTLGNEQSASGPPPSTATGDMLAMF